MSDAGLWVMIALLLGSAILAGLFDDLVGP